MKTHLERALKNNAWVLTQCILIGFLLAQGCGQAKVDFSKVEVVPPPVAQALPEVPPSETEVETPLPKVSRLGFLSLTSEASLMDWQTWSPVRQHGSATLSRDELGSMGDTVAKTTAERSDTVTRLRGFGYSQRCVFRNRLIDRDAAHVRRIQLPEPMGSLELLCVDRISQDERVTPMMDIAVSKNEVTRGVRWLGTNAARSVPTSGSPARLDFKVSQIIGMKQGFGLGIRTILPDQFDAAINVELEGAKRGGDCGATRTAYVQLKMEKGLVTGGRAYVHTRLVSQRQTARSRTVITQPEFATPQLDPAAAEACAPQRAAWVACLKRQADCSTGVDYLVRENFSHLLDTKVTGFVSESVMATTRAEANGQGSRGAKDLAQWKSELKSDTSDVNPLSVEDFQEMIEVIDLIPDASFHLN